MERAWMTLDFQWYHRRMAEMTDTVRGRGQWRQPRMHARVMRWICVVWG
jgi:hypothetical protein